MRIDAGCKGQNMSLPFLACSGEVRTVSINSCLATVGSLDGMAVTTVEGIGNSETGLHGVQGAHAVLSWSDASRPALLISDMHLQSSSC